MAPADPNSSLNRPTPPNWPIHEIALDPDQISHVIGQAFPNSSLVSYNELEQGKSFNNRIYFVRVSHPSEYTTAYSVDHPTEVVLKIIGRFFDKRKVQNEVACLLLLQNHCPEVPTSRIVAWSEDGARVCTIEDGAVKTTVYKPVKKKNRKGEDKLVGSPHGWVLQTKMPGKILTQTDLAGPSAQYLAHQLAGHMGAWRNQMPHSNIFGNYELKVAGDISRQILGGIEANLAGLWLCENQPSRPLISNFEYYSHLLTDAIYKLEHNSHFATIQLRLLPRLEDFLSDVLPYLSCFKSVSAQSPVFAHADFAPRNVLVEEQPQASVTSTDEAATEESLLHITGILDFEFAGFAPSNSDFITSEHEWPKEFWTSFLEHLATLDRRVPFSGKYSEPEATDAQPTIYYEQEKTVAKLIDQSAPWWLENGHDELKAECEKAILLIEEYLDALEAAI